MRSCWAFSFCNVQACHGIPPDVCQVRRLPGATFARCAQSVYRSMKRNCFVPSKQTNNCKRSSGDAVTPARTPAPTQEPARTRPRVEGEREREILEAALVSLVELGYDRLTFDAVAATAKASKATLYRRWHG